MPTAGLFNLTACERCGGRRSLSTVMARRAHNRLNRRLLGAVRAGFTLALAVGVALVSDLIRAKVSAGAALREPNVNDEWYFVYGPSKQAAVILVCAGRRLPLATLEGGWRRACECCCSVTESSNIPVHVGHFHTDCGHPVILG